MENKDKNQLKIELTPEIAEGIYSNLAIISHSSSEFVVDFVRIMPGTPKANVKSRIILLLSMQNVCCLLCKILWLSLKVKMVRLN